MGTVDQQIDRFEELFRNDLTCQLITGINRRYWEDMDELDHETKNLIPLMIRYTMNDLLMRYRGTPVEPVLEIMYDRLSMAAVTALNVPFPRNYILHLTLS